MNELLRTLVDTRDRQVQKARIQFGNRLFAIESGLDTAGEGEVEILERYNEHFKVMENQLDADIEEMVSLEPIYPFVSELKGIGPGLSAKLIAMIDIERAPTVSALWRYAGYAVINGEREKPTKGEKLHYNKRLKTTCYLVATSFMRCSSPYRAIYDEAREHYDKVQPEWTKGHKHNAALRKMIKIFLQHLWLTWREVAGLPTSGPYVHDVMSHTHYRAREEFGWKVLAGEQV